MPDDHSHINVQLASLDARIAGIEVWKAEQQTSTAVREERDKHIDQRFDRVEKSVNEVKGYLLKIMWVIILGIVGSLVTFVVTGGTVGP